MSKFMAMWQQAEDRRTEQEEKRREEDILQQHRWMQLIAEALVPGTAGVASYQPLAHTSSTTELALVRARSQERAQAQQEQESAAQQTLEEAIIHTLDPSDSELDAKVAKKMTVTVYSMQKVSRRQWKNMKDLKQRSKYGCSWDYVDIIKGLSPPTPP